MTLSRPYKRIARPFNRPDGDYWGGAVGNTYIIDPDYAPDRNTTIRAFYGIQGDLCRCFEYVEPDDKNLHTFSTRLYEILLRAATEFESNSKSILKANGYTDRGMNITDYQKIDQATRLSSYEVKLMLWSGAPRIVKPFASWTSTNPSWTSTNHRLSWYQAYNSVKHNRVAKFELANLENAVEAVAALFVILFAQFSILAFSTHELSSLHDSSGGWLAHPNSVFWVKVPNNWDVEECYGFNNGDLHSLTPKFENFVFT